MAASPLLDLAGLRALLGAAVRERALAPGEALFRQGDPASAVFGLIAGRVRLVRDGAEGNRLTVHTARPGESFAEAALFSDAYHCDCLADIASRVWVFPRRAVRRAMDSNPQLATAMAARMAGHVQGLRARLAVRGLKTARDRVIAHLLLACPPGETIAVLDCTMKDMASEIGLTHEALYRTLAALEGQGRIRRDGRRIEILAAT